MRNKRLQILLFVSASLLFFSISIQLFSLYQVLSLVKVSSDVAAVQNGLESHVNTIEMSPRFAIFTGRSSFETKYYESFESAVGLLKETKERNLVYEDSNLFDGLQLAIKDRERIDSKAFEFMRNENSKDAVAVLDSIEYETASNNLKNSYAKILNVYEKQQEHFYKQIRQMMIISLVLLVLTLAAIGFLAFDWAKTISAFADKLEKKVQEKTKSLNEAQTIAKTGSWTLELATNELDWSQEQYRIFEISPDFKNSKLVEAYSERIDKEDLSKLEFLLQDIKSAGERFFLECRLNFNNGARVKNVLYTVNAVKDENGQILKLLGTCQDITEQENARKQIEVERAKSLHTAKLASLGEMSAGIAHEINNPLAVIAGNLPLLKKFRTDEEKFGLKLESLARAAIRIEKIVKGLKKFSRTSVGNDFKLESITNIVSEVLTITEAKVKRHTVDISTEIAPDLYIHCDEVEIEQVLVNLINNGVDAIKTNDVRWVKLKAFAENDMVVIHVIDSGNGISEELENKMFQPFFTTKIVGEGTGLGLSISKGILDNHRAQFSINRTYKNTCFEIKFQRANALRMSHAG